MEFVASAVWLDSRVGGSIGPSIVVELGAGTLLGIWFIVVERRVERKVDELRRELGADVTSTWEEHASAALERARKEKYVDQLAANLLKAPGGYTSWRRTFRALAIAGSRGTRTWSASIDLSESSRGWVTLDVHDDHMTIATFEGTMDDYDETETKLVEPDSRVGRRRGGKSDWWEGVSFAELLDELRFACTKGGARTDFIDDLPRSVRSLPQSLVLAVQFASDSGFDVGQLTALLTDEWAVQAEAKGGIVLTHVSGWVSATLERPTRLGVPIPEVPPFGDPSEWASLVAQANNLRY